jgi:hypothetical protein
LPYDQATDFWWGLQALCFVITGVLLYQHVTVDRAWRPTVWLAWLAFYPIWDTVLHGQLSAMLLLVLVVGLELQHRRHPLWGAFVLSLLAMKPQFFAGMFIWFLLRRDWRSLPAITAGLVCQLAALAVFVGPSIIVDYIAFLPTCGKISLQYAFSPWAEHGIAGIVQNVLLWVACPKEWGHLAGTIVQFVVAGWAGLMLYRIASTERLASLANASTAAPCEAASMPTFREQTAAVLFSILLTPHLLTYDLVLLAAPLVYLWSSVHWRFGIVVYFAASMLVIPLYNTIGFSLVPMVTAVVLYRMSYDQ